MATGSGSRGRSLAMRLIAHEMERAPDLQVGAAGVIVGEKLLAEIGQFIGPQGFQVMLARALHLARLDYPFLSGVAAGDAAAGSCLPGLSESLAGQDATQAIAAAAAVLGGFIDLLATFIGDDLTLRMIHRRWPDVPRALPSVGDRKELE